MQEHEPTVEECADYILSLPGYTEVYPREILEIYRRRVGRTASMRFIIPDETLSYDGSFFDRMHVSALPEWLMQGMDPPPGTIVRPEREGDAEDS